MCRELADRAQSPPAVRLDESTNRFTSAGPRQRGREALAAGQIGVVLVAGGQGTRLGFDHPKGMFPIGPVSRRSLFQIHVEKILAAARRYGVRDPAVPDDQPGDARRDGRVLRRARPLRPARART